MTLQEAIEEVANSEHRYRYIRNGVSGIRLYGAVLGTYLYEEGSQDPYALGVPALLSSKWEVEPVPEKRVEITATQLDKAFADSLKRSQDMMGDIHDLACILKKELGL